MPVHERLAADEAHIGLQPHRVEEIFAAAEADLEPDLADGMRNRLARSGIAPASGSRNLGSASAICCA